MINYRYNTGDYIETQTGLGNFISIKVHDLNKYLRRTLNLSDWRLKYQERENRINTYVRKTFRCAYDKPGEDGSFIPHYLTTHVKEKGSNKYILKKGINFYSCCEEASRIGCRLITAGLTPSEKELLVVDVDEKWPTGNPLIKNNFKKGVDLIRSKSLELIGIEPSNIVVNIIRKPIENDMFHYQISFYVKDGYFCPAWGNKLFSETSNDEDRYKYNLHTKALAIAFNSDSAFHGPWCKNVMGGPDLLTWNSNLEYTKDEIDKALDKYIKVINSSKKEKEEIDRLDNRVEYSSYKDISYYTSRNVYSFNEARTASFKLKKKKLSRGEDLTLNDVINIVREKEYESLSINGKTSIESNTQIINTAQGVYDFVQSNFDISKLKSNDKIKGPMTLIESSNEAKKADKCIGSLKFRILKDKEMTNKEIALTLGVSQNTITNYSKISYEEALDCVYQYMNIHKNSNIENVKKRIEIIEELLSILNTEAFEEEISKEEIENIKKNIREINLFSQDISDRLDNIFNYLSIRILWKLQRKRSVNLRELIPKLYEFKDYYEEEIAS